MNRPLPEPEPMATAHSDLPSVAQLAAALPEIYQPIFGHPVLAAAPSRVSIDRLVVVQAVYDALAAHLGRPGKVLDLGCAQGFFCFSLAERGASVTGIDFLEPNIALCERLAADHPSLSVRFQQAGIESIIPSVQQGEYDLVLGLSVFHHLVHERGVAAVVALMAQLAERVHCGIFEMALRDEPVHWAASQPANEQELLSPFVFRHQLGRFSTHLSSVTRPVMYASSRAWYLDGQMHAIEHWSEQSHPLAGQVHEGTRRYYFGDGLIAKRFCLRGRMADVNRDDIEAEARVLTQPPAALRRAPALQSWGVSDTAAWLVREKLPGRLLLELVRSGTTYDAEKIIRSVLKQLVALEDAGLFHADLRVWNVLVGDDGEPTLIDYGAIGPTRQDCTWPQDLILSFTIFIYEVASGQVERIQPQRKPYVSPLNLPAPYRGWIAALWQCPPAQWSFRRLAEWTKLPPQPSALEETTALERWMAAVERHLDMVGSHAAHVEGTVRTLAHEIHATVEPRLETLSSDVSQWRNELGAARSVVEQCSDRLAWLSNNAEAEAARWRETDQKHGQEVEALMRLTAQQGDAIAALRAAHELAEHRQLADAERLERIERLAEGSGQNVQQAVELFNGLSATAMRSFKLLEESLYPLREDLNSLRARIAELHDDQRAVSAREQETQAAHQALLARTAAMEAGLAASHDHLQRILRSRSWRVVMLLQRLLRALRLR